MLGDGDSATYNTIVENKPYGEDCIPSKVKENANEEGECGISIGGTWQKRGHVSHNGVVTVISLDSKKCLDAEILSDKRQQFQKWQAKTNDPKYHEWKASHNCEVNHTGSANSMETVGALRIFE